MDRYKKKALNFSSGIENKNVRQMQRNVERRNSRHVRLSALRNIQNSSLELSLDDDISGCEKPAGNITKTKLDQQQPSRFDMLMKWKKEKELKKVFASKSQPFLTSRVNHKPGTVFPAPLIVAAAKNTVSSTINTTSRSFLRPPQAPLKQTNTAANVIKKPQMPAPKSIPKQNNAVANTIKKPQMPPPKCIPKQSSQIKSSLPSKSKGAKTLTSIVNSQNGSSTSRLQRPTAINPVSGPQSEQNQPNKSKLPSHGKPAVSKGTNSIPVQKPSGIRNHTAYVSQKSIPQVNVNKGAPKALTKPAISSRQKMILTAKDKSSPKASDLSNVKKSESRPSFAPMDFVFSAPINIRSIFFPNKPEKKSMCLTPNRFSFVSLRTPRQSSLKKLNSPSQKKRNAAVPSNAESPSILKASSAASRSRLSNKQEKIESKELVEPVHLTNSVDQPLQAEIMKEEDLPLNENVHSGDMITNENDDELFNEKPPEAIYGDDLDVSLSISSFNLSEAGNDAEDPATDLKAILSMCPPKRVSERLSKRMSFFAPGDKPKLNCITESAEAFVDSPGISILKDWKSPTFGLTPRRSRRVASKHVTEGSPVINTYTIGSVIDTPNKPFSAMNSATPEQKKRASNGTSSTKKSPNSSNEENFMFFSPEVTPRRRSSRILQKTPLQAIDNRSVEIGSTSVESPGKFVVHQQRKISLLGSPRQAKTRQSTIKGDLMAFSPDV